MQFSHYTCDSSTATVDAINNHHTPRVAYVQRTNYNPAMMSSDSNDTSMNTIYCYLPPYFVHSRSPNKEIQLLIFRVFDLTTGTEIQASMHSDICMMDASADNYIASSSTLYTIPKRYKIGDNRSVFQLWFRDLYGNLLNIQPDKVRIIVEFVLSY